MPMPMTILRFNMINPDLDPQGMSERYNAMLDMAEFADGLGLYGISLEEHHGASNGWSPTPMMNAAMILARTKTLTCNISALLLPLHDPIRVAEDLAVIDLMSGGRCTTIVGLGYRPEEYHLHGKEWTRRGKIMDECVDTVLKAWTGEPFEYRGETVQVTPVPITKPHPMLLLGGTSKAACRRAARFGLPMMLAASVPELESYYYEQCEAHGTQGFLMMPSEDTVMMWIAEDPDKAWAELGQHFFHEASTYASWQTPDIKSAVHSGASSPEELRAEGIYQILTPAEVVAHVEAGAPALTLHPLVGGMPIDKGWECLNLLADEVLPALAD